MREVRLVLVSAAAVIIVCIPVISPPAFASPGERVAASFSQGSGNRIVISAAGDPASEGATGFIRNTVNTQTLFYELRVTCLVVVGERAVIGGEITASEFFPGHVGSGLVFWVEDAGEPGIGTDKASHSLSSDPQPLPGTDCPATRDPGFPIEAGNVQVLGVGP